MADFAFVLEDLRKQFPGQLVLYVADIATILRKSNKAIAELIARNDLPFRIKRVGGLRCADIYAVAQWLSSDIELAEETRAQESRPKRPKASLTAVKGGGLTPALPSTVEMPQHLTGTKAAQILRARNTRTAEMGRFVYGLRSPDELAFMSEVFEALYFGPEAQALTFTVTIRKLCAPGSNRIAKMSVQCFGTQDAATDYLLTQLIRVCNLEHKLLTHYLMDHEGQRIFHVVVNGRTWTHVNNVIGLAYGG
jgi:hypothetical protein